MDRVRSDGLAFVVPMGHRSYCRQWTSPIPSLSLSVDMHLTFQAARGCNILPAAGIQLNQYILPALCTSQALGGQGALTIAQPCIRGTRVMLLVATNVVRWEDTGRAYGTKAHGPV